MRVRTGRLTRGRSRQSYLLVAARHLHVFVWGPWTGQDDSLGVTVRWRRDRDWRHVRLIILQRNPKRRGDMRRKHPGRVGQRFLLRRTLTIFEASTWTTTNGTQERADMKVYLRLKAGVGGRRIATEGGVPTATH